MISGGPLSKVPENSVWILIPGQITAQRFPHPSTLREQKFKGGRKTRISNWEFFWITGTKNRRLQLYSEIFTVFSGGLDFRGGRLFDPSWKRQSEREA
jgi:hypothetical protein